LLNFESSKLKSSSSNSASKLMSGSSNSASGYGKATGSGRCAANRRLIKRQSFAEHLRCHIYGEISAWRTGMFINGNLPQSIWGIAFKDGADCRVTDMPIPPLKSDVTLSSGAPVRHPVGRGQHGFTGASIGFQNYLATLGHRCGPKIAPNPQTANGIAMGVPVEML
jgi:hypothetical protein